MEKQNSTDPAGKIPAQNNKSRLEESSIFASRPRLAEREQMQARQAAKNRSGRKWFFVGVVAIVLVIAVTLSSGANGSGAQASNQLAGFAGGSDSGTPTPTSVPTQTFTPEATFTPSASPTPTLGVGSSSVRPSDGMVMMYVPSGPFTMGISLEEAMAECIKVRGECDPSWFIDEQPAHVVELNAYWMDQTEVTNTMYALCVNSGNCTAPRQSGSNLVENYYDNPAYAEYPVTFVTWKQANTYCEWAGGKLPTEAEWEKAARGTDGRVYPWGNSAPGCGLLNLNPFNLDTCKDDTTPARDYIEGQSPYQILNMAGNVAEWVSDWYDQNYYSVSPGINPQGPADGLAKIMRGGSWYFDELFARTTYRYKQDARYYYSFTGFRCAMPAQ